MNTAGEPDDDVHCPERWQSEHINMIIQKGDVLP